MATLVNKISRYMGSHRGLVIIVLAALLLELISAAQYYYTHHLLEDELDKRAESELRMKAILIIGTLNTMENTLQEHLWDIRYNINHADSMFEATRRIIEVNPMVMGSFLTFVPDYYPEKGRLFEPYAYKDAGSIHLMDLAKKEGNDYPNNPMFIKMMSDDKPCWSDPYNHEDDGVNKQLITYSYPLHDDEGRLIALSGIDISLDWLGDTLNVRHIYPSSFLLLLTESGQLISKPNNDHVKMNDVDRVVSMINDSTVKRTDSNSGHSKIIRFKSENGDDASVFFANLKGEPHWQIAVVCYDKEVYEKLYSMRFNILLLMLLVFGILGLIIRHFMLNERRLSLANSEKERIGNELRIATLIQNAMLDQGGGMAGHSDVVVDAILKPAREVGGDLYSYFIRDEKLFFCIGDVSGKGIPSALVMAMTQALFQAVSAHEGNPAHIMRTINETACRNNKTNMFATLFIGVLDLPTGRLRYCNAGHDAPFVMEGAEVTPLPVKANLPAGLFDDFHYEMQEAIVPNDATLFLYTDGLTEARNAGHKQFGLNRVKAALDELTGRQPCEIISLMTERVGQFVEEEEASDDLTMLAIRYTGQPDDYMVHGELVLKNDVSQLKFLHDLLKSVAESHGMSVSDTRNLRLAVEEAVVNVMEYAYPVGTEGLVTVRALSDSRDLKIIISDSGVAFDPTVASRADTTLSAEDRPVGGLGILLVRELMDSINYERIDGKNVLTLKKKLNQQSS